MLKNQTHHTIYCMVLDMKYRLSAKVYFLLGFLLFSSSKEPLYNTIQFVMKKGLVYYYLKVVIA